jgi:CheY-like chemotaxis protein
MENFLKVTESNARYGFISAPSVGCHTQDAPCARCRHSELGNSTVNIIMLTTENSAAMKERGKAAGIKGWIVKPFKGDAVIATFKKLVAS